MIRLFCVNFQVVFLLTVSMARVFAADSGYFEKVFPAPENPLPGELSMPAEWRIWIP
jgi:hypothetical protein